MLKYVYIYIYMYIFSFWYDSTLDWTPVSWVIGKHSNYYANGPIYIYIYMCVCVCIYICICIYIYMYIYMFIYMCVYIIIIIMSCHHQHGYPWLFLATILYCPLLPLGLQSYICTELLYVGSSWLSCLCLFMWRIHKSLSLMSLSLLLQQCPACLFLLTWILFTQPLRSGRIWHKVNF